MSKRMHKLYRVGSHPTIIAMLGRCENAVNKASDLTTKSRAKQRKKRFGITTKKSEE